jgi:hypothetical protein
VFPRVFPFLWVVRSIDSIFGAGLGTMAAAYGLLPTPLLHAFMMPKREKGEVELDHQIFHFPSIGEFPKTALSQIVTAFDGRQFALV